MNQPPPQGSTPPKLSPAEAEAIFEAMEHELLLQRARRTAGERPYGAAPGKWVLLVGSMFLLLGVMLAGFWHLNAQLRSVEAAGAAIRPPAPTSVTPKR